MERVRVETPTRSPTGATNVYLVGDEQTLLVDPATRSEALDVALEERGVDHVAITHHHPDHAGAVADYAERFDATVWARAGRETDFAVAAGVEPDRTFSEGTTIPVADGVEVVETPGHVPEHVTFATDEGTLVGDLAVAEGSVAVAAPEGDVRAYCTSLRRLLARDPPTAFPGHGPVIEDPAETFERLLAHRTDRERRVQDAVAGGADTVAAVTDAAYEKDVTAVRDLAERTVRAHLVKLARAGRVSRDWLTGDPAAMGGSPPATGE